MCVCVCPPTYLKSVDLVCIYACCVCVSGFYACICVCVYPAINLVCMDFFMCVCVPFRYLKSINVVYVCVCVCPSGIAMWGWWMAQARMCVMARMTAASLGRMTCLRMMGPRCGWMDGWMDIHVALRAVAVCVCVCTTVLDASHGDVNTYLHCCFGRKDACT